MTAARAARPKPSKSAPRKRAKPVPDWLEFISPHVDTYGRLGRGEQKEFVAKLCKTSGTDENTLRRFIWAFKFLETLGITSLPSGLKHLPVASIEAVARISKKDPELGHRLLQELLKGEQTIQSLKAELARLNKPRKRSIDRSAVPEISERELRTLLAGLGRDVDPNTIEILEFFSSDAMPGDLDPLARPRVTATLPDGRRVLVFDESTIAWKASAERARREFIRNVKIATTDFDFVAVFCSALYAEVERRCRAMRLVPCDRVLVHIGRLEADVGQSWAASFVESGPPKTRE